MPTPAFDVDAELMNALSDLTRTAQAVVASRHIINATLRDNHWYGILMQEPPEGKIVAEVTAAPGETRVFLCALRYRDQKDTHLLLKLKIDLSGERALVTPHLCQIIERNAA